MSEPTRGYFEEYRCGCVYRWGKFDRPSVATLVAALDAERNNRFAADEAMVTLHEALQKAETELDAERRRAEGAEAEVRHLREAKNCYYDCVSKHEANQRIAEAQEEALEMVRPMIAAAEAERDALRQEVAGLRAGLERMMPLAERAALVIAHHALNSRECSLVCRRCEAEKVLAQARQLLDRRSDAEGGQAP